MGAGLVGSSRVPLGWADGAQSESGGGGGCCGGGVTGVGVGDRGGRGREHLPWPLVRGITIVMGVKVRLLLPLFLGSPRHVHASIS